MKIARAAIRYKEIGSNDFKIGIGFRHSIILSEMYKKGVEYDRNDYQMGFITDERPMHFVTRKEAAKIAYEAGQVPELKDTIYSEDLWEYPYID